MNTCSKGGRDGIAAPARGVFGSPPAAGYRDEFQDWKTAADLAEDVARLEGFWAPGHPYTALHRLRCAKLQNLVGNETAAQVHIMLALVRLVVSHGKESSLAKEAADMQARVIHKREGRTLVEDASSDDDYDWRKGMRPW